MKFFNEFTKFLSAFQDAFPLLIGGVCLFLILETYIFASRTGIIARATSKEAMRQPIFVFLVFVAIVLQIINTFVPFYSFGDDIKMLKDCSLATILISGLLISVWTASTSIAEEIEGKTAMTLLSKPINRQQFILGKYLGIIESIFFYMLPVSIVFLALVYYKVGYDARETVQDPPEFAIRIQHVIRLLPGLALLYMEISVFAAISVAISTRLPMIVNLTICLALFVVGHLTPVLIQAGKNKLEFVTFVARLIATITPSLETFNISAAIATDGVVPASYVGLSTIYCGCYCAAAILFAYILFEDRDLA